MMSNEHNGIGEYESEKGSEAALSGGTGVIEITRFGLESIRSDGHGQYKAERIYQESDLIAYEGELVLILGPSGGGKSLLANYLLDFVHAYTETLLLDPSSRLTVRLGGEEYPLFGELYPKALEGRIGIMLQGLGLFEDLSAEDNLRFANDQAREPRQGDAWALWLKQTWRDLGLDDGLRNEHVGRLSGGQRQRVALGRMLAYRPEIMIFDEPTSALDPLAAQNAVELIRTAHRQGGSRLTLVITHDYDHFVPFADRVWFLTQDRRFINDAPPRDARTYGSLLEQPRVPASRPLEHDERLTHEARCRDRWWNVAIEHLVRALERGRKSIANPWFARYLAHFMNELLVKGLPFHLMAGFALGLVATYFSFNAELGRVAVGGEELEVSRFILPTFFEDMLSGFAIVLYRALIPLFTCVFIAARAGTAVTAYLSEMRDERAQQWDAMRAFGIDPYFFFLPQLLFSFAIAATVLSYGAFWFASAGSLIVSLATNPLCSYYTWHDAFWSSLEPRWGLWFAGTPLFIVKTALSGAAIALISTYFGTRERQSSIETMKHLSSANIWSIMSILVIFFVVLLWEMG